MTVPDPLAAFFTTPITVMRKTGDTPAGPTFAAPDKSLRGKVKNETRVVRTADGREVVSQARVALPFATPTIPIESRVILPNGRTAAVLVEEHIDSGLSYLPNYYVIDVAVTRVI